MPAPTPSEVIVPNQYDLGTWLQEASVNDSIMILWNNAVIKITKKGAESLDIEYYNDCPENSRTSYQVIVKGANAILNGSKSCSNQSASGLESDMTEAFGEDGYTNLTFATNNNLKWYDVQGKFDY